MHKVRRGRHSFVHRVYSCVRMSGRKASLADGILDARANCPTPAGEQSPRLRLASVRRLAHVDLNFERLRHLQNKFRSDSIPSNCISMYILDLV